MKRLDVNLFAIVGVNSDQNRDLLKPVLENEQITWRSFWNGKEGTGGPISRKWRVNGWPTLYVLDRQGVIRHKFVGSPGAEKLDKVIDALVKGAEKK